MNWLRPYISFAAVFLFLTGNLFAQTGKISGRITDSESNEPLVGVNVILVGTDQGAATNQNGYYTIINVTPGTYDLQASYIGYAQTTMENIRVNIDLTTTVEFQLQSEALAGEEVVVEAARPVIRADISANVSNVSTDEIIHLPLTSVEDVVGLEAGVEPGLSVRGSGLSEVNFMVDGMSMRDGRENTPYTTVSYTSIEEVKMQTGGFNAEYGNVRSGLVNIVTKEGSKNRYSADLMVRYAPPQRDYFGNLPNHPDSYWMRPYVDNPDIPNDLDPAFVGTHSGESIWNEWTRRQYPQFEGWNQIVTEFAEDGDPNNDFDLAGVQELFWWRHRKSLDVEDPEYVVDASLGGPVPFISSFLGDLRFFTSYRKTQRPYYIPSLRDYYWEQLGRIKVSSDISQSMKLRIEGMLSGEYGIQPSGQGFPNMWKGETPIYPWQNRGMSSQLAGGNSGGGAEVFADWTDNPSDVFRNMIGFDFTHTLSSRTFYEINVQRMFSDYNTYLPDDAWRNPDEVAITIGGIPVDAAPMGYWYANIFSPSDMALGGHWAKARDSSTVALYTGRFDITSQLNHFTQMKAGMEYTYGVYHINHRQKEIFFTNNAAPAYKWDREPTQGAAYLQTKLEFQSLVTNLGIRLDYWNAGGEWYDYDVYTPVFSATYGKDMLDELLETSPTKPQLFLSPRIGVSFPVTAESKIYFNYGHFRQMLDPHNLFSIREINTGAVDRIGNPTHPLPRTVSYELGYEHSLFEQLLVRLSGYYKAKDNQSRNVRYINLDGLVSYAHPEPLNYEDIRGFEVTLRKTAGRWIRGFANYTYMVVKEGNFGFSNQYENRAEQRQHERLSRAHYQELPVPQPYGRFNLEFFTPLEFGPRIARLNPLSDLHMSLLGEWRSGRTFTWTGQVQILGLEDNVRWRDYFNVDLRLSKNFSLFESVIAQLFVDVKNVFNLKHLHMDSFYGEYDWEYYMESLHLSENTFGEYNAPYEYIAGDDRPGEYRKTGVDFVPIEITTNINDVGDPHTRPLYFDKSTNEYMKWSGEAWEQAEPGFVDQVLEDKAYIDMPNLDYKRFMNPRQIMIGIRLSF